METTGEGKKFILSDEELKEMRSTIKKILDLTSLPVEPLVYTEPEFEEMKEGIFLKQALAVGKEL